MDVVALPPTLLDLLNELFTRTFIGAGTYVFESQPYAVAEDADLLEQLRAIKEQDRDHATLLAGLLRSHGHVPEPGVFPYWHRDVNYLTVPFMAGFVAESLQTDLDVLARAQVRAPAALEDVHATLQVIGAEREALLAALAPAAVAAKQREAEAYAAASRALREAREARLAAEKAAEAARKEAERAKKAAAKAKADAAAAATAAPAADPTAGMPDPNEPGISSKEKAKRTMMIRRARKAAETAAAPAAAPTPAADPTAGMPDPDEPGISAKEKAKRTVLRKRAAKAAAAPTATTPESPAAAAPEPAAAPAQSLDEILAAMPDPDEPGISGKEKAKRTVMRNRAKKAFEAE